MSLNPLVSRNTYVRIVQKKNMELELKLKQKPNKSHQRQTDQAARKYCQATFFNPVGVSIYLCIT